MNTTLTKSQLDDLMKLRFAGNGPYFFDPSVIGTDGRAIAPTGSAPFSGQVFFTPPAGSLGSLQRRLFSGPWDTGFDFSLAKSTKIFERQSIVLRMDAANFFNHPAFRIADQTVTSSSFGSVTQTAFTSRRVIQFTARYNF